MKTVSLEQNTEQWLEFRKTKVGASDAPIIMNDSPWSTPFELWERKLGFREELTQSFAMSEGKKYEEMARWTFEEMLGIQFMPVVGVNDEYPWMIASFDGFSDTGKAVEIKCPGSEDIKSAKNGIVPKKYRYQLQHQLAVSGLDMIYYYSFDKNNHSDTSNRGVIIEVKRDQAMIDKMIEQELTFLHCLQNCIPPELEERDYNIRHDAEWQFAVKNWKSANEKAKIYKKDEEHARQLLIHSCHSMNSKGEGVRVQKIMRKGFVDYSKIKELEGINMDQYRSDPIQSWRIVQEGSKGNTGCDHS